MHSTCNISTIKVMGQCIKKHNAEILREPNTNKSKRQSKCNCQNQNKQDCPMPGECNTNGVVYPATVATDNGGSETYVGLA